jgi:type I restriction enzyme M protein
MAVKDILYIVLKEFTQPWANFHPDKISNLEMGYVFEDIIRRFSEVHNEDAGQHHTVDGHIANSSKERTCLLDMAIH